MPSGLGALTSLVALGLRNTDITTLPSEIGALTALTLMYVDNSELTAVPGELAALTALDNLRLNGNNLAGVPAAFRQVDPTFQCWLDSNAGFSCANVGASTECCSEENCGSVSSCYTGA